MSLKSKMKKSTSVVLALSMVLASNPVTFAARNDSGVSLSSKAKKLIKYPLAIGGAIALGTGSYYAGDKILNKMYPSEQILKENIKQARKELPELEKRYLNKETSKEEKRQLLEEINFRRQLINEKAKSTSEILASLPVLGGIAFCAKGILSAIDNLGDISKRIANISYLSYAFTNFKMMKNAIASYFEKTPSEVSKDEIFSNFDKAFSDIKGQDEAIHQVKNHLYDIVIAKNQAKWKNEKYSHGDVLYFHGLSGVGKTSVSTAISNILYENPKIYTVTPSDVDKESTESVVSQLFGSKEPASPNPYFPQVPKQNNLTNFLKNNPNGIVRIEEYDKMCTPALDEVLRTVMECGIVNVNGEKIDCSGILFILTSNEDKISMEGFDKEDSKKLDKESIAKGYTRVWHDKSFLNRVRKVEFKNLSHKSYEIIMKNHFDQLAEFWADSKNAGIKLTIDDETIKDLATEVENLNQGARSIDLKILPLLQGEIGNEIKLAPNLDFYRNKTLKVSYDMQNKKFILKEC